MTVNDLALYFQNKFLLCYTALILNNIIVLLIILIKIKIGYVKIPHGRFLTTSLLFAMMINLIDLYWEWVSEGPLVITPEAGMYVNTLYFIILHFMYFYIFIYFYACVTNAHLSDSKVAVMIIPTAVTIALNLLNLKFHMLFYMSPNSEYMRGHLYALEYVVPYTYLLVPYIKAASIIHTANKEKLPYRKINRDILIVPMTIGVMGTIGMFTNTIPFLSIALTFGPLFIYLNLVEDYVTVDPISSLPNRPEFIEELKRRIDIENLKHRDNLYIIIVDILHLKHLNERFGYSEGDNVIRRISNILRRKSTISDKLNLFVCRYSGTKYFLIANTDVPEDIIAFCTNLQLKINNSNTINLVEYEINVMYGFSKYKKGMHISEFIDDATKNLEMNKFKFEKLQSLKEKKET